MLRTIVLVEDDDVIREYYADMITDEGFDEKAFGNRKDAIGCYSQGFPILPYFISVWMKKEKGNWKVRASEQDASYIPDHVFYRSV